MRKSRGLPLVDDLNSAHSAHGATSAKAMRRVAALAEIAEIEFANDAMSMAPIVLTCGDRAKDTSAHRCVHC